MKVVLTGGPCCGKSTIIHELQSEGHLFMTEIAREVIKEIGKENIKDEVAFQNEIYARQIARESIIDYSDEVVFLDRGIMDGYAYSIRNINRIPKEISSPTTKRYELVLLLDRLPLVLDGERREENEEEAN